MNALRRLWHDESGVVLGLTVISFLSMLVVTGSVYAVGETVRQRIELQNAADAAAYSAAVVQADAISRVAALNRAMAWTYVQMVKHEMDFIVDRWLALTLKKWNRDLKTAKAFAKKGTCNTYDYYAGSQFMPRHIRINNRKWYWDISLKGIRALAAVKGKHYQIQRVRIIQDRLRIRKLNKAQQRIIADLPGHIQETVRRTLKSNLSETWNDRLESRGANFQFTIQYKNWRAIANARYLERSSIFEIVRDEREFLNYADKGRDPVPVFGSGIHDRRVPGWFVLKRGVNGIQRAYKQKRNYLIAKWSRAARAWYRLPKVGCVPLQFLFATRNMVTGLDAKRGNGYFFKTELAVPWRLKKSFFGRDGTIVVGVSRRVNNPMQFMIGDQRRPGVYGAYAMASDRTMWTAAAARAGFQPIEGRGRYAQAPGSYLSTWPVPDNLKWSDWDGLLLPLHRAWATGSRRSWRGQTGGMILSGLRARAAWRPVFGGGDGRWGRDMAPPGMRGRLSYRSRSVERMVIH